MYQTKLKKNYVPETHTIPLYISWRGASFSSARGICIVRIFRTGLLRAVHLRACMNNGRLDIYRRSRPTYGGNLRPPMFLAAYVEESQVIPNIICLGMSRRDNGRHQNAYFYKWKYYSGVGIATLKSRHLGIARSAKTMFEFHNSSKNTILNVDLRINSSLPPRLGCLGVRHYNSVRVSAWNHLVTNWDEQTSFLLRCLCYLMNTIGVIISGRGSRARDDGHLLPVQLPAIPDWTRTHCRTFAYHIQVRDQHKRRGSKTCIAVIHVLAGNKICRPLDHSRI